MPGITDFVPTPHPYIPGGFDCVVCAMSEDNPIHAQIGEIEPETAEESNNTGVMVALYPDSDVAVGLALDVEGAEPPEELHLTLAYLGKAVNLTPQQMLALRIIVAGFAYTSAPIEAQISGVGLFEMPEGRPPVTYASIDGPTLPDFRHALVEALTAAGLPVSTDHGFTPHMTLAYNRVPAQLDLQNIVFREVSVVIGDERDDYAIGMPTERAARVLKMSDGKYPIANQSDANDAWKLRSHSTTHSEASVVAHIRRACKELGLKFPGDQQASETEPNGMASYTSGGQTYTLNMTSSDAGGVTFYVNGKPYIPARTEAREPADKHEQAANDTIHAFVTHTADKTLITAPVTTADLGIWEKALTPNEHMLWLQGRLVGADEPNRNGALWSTKDLELGEPTVRYGPLNWLHEAHHVIGVLSDNRMVYPSSETADEGTKQPHIAVAAAVWRWLYPQETAVLEMASESKNLWLSMECISKQVECAGAAGCGHTVEYLDYLRRNGTCAHMSESGGVQRFVDPTFLGAGIIVPPARPGWPEASANIMREAASLAEDTYEQMGNPSALTATEVEQILGQVLTFAKV